MMKKIPCSVKITALILLLCFLPILGQYDSDSKNFKSETLSISNSNGNFLPSDLTGIIVLWFGNLSSIPEGWALCDGANGTPNLTNKFIMSVGEFENPGETGGSINHSHPYDELPLHNHVKNDPGHRHWLYEKDGSMGPRAESNVATGIDRAYDYSMATETSSTKIHFDLYPAGVEDCVSDESSSLPMYIRLAYIIKTAPNDGEVVLPAHSILGWVESYNTIPNGWILCNGSLFSSNLTNRFIYSTNNAEQIGGFGGNALHNHSYSDLPLHDHEVDIDPHYHQLGVSRISEDIVPGSDVSTLGTLTQIFDTNPTTSGITIMESGYLDCVTSNTETNPPYFRMSFITTNESTSYLPNNSIFWWADGVHKIPEFTSQYKGTSNSSIYNRFVLATVNGSLIGTIGGNEEHVHSYYKVPMHTHIIAEAVHTHSYPRISSTLYSVSLASNHKYVSNPIVNYVQSSLAYSGVNIKPAGQSFCKTDTASSIPP
ncbi:MAG: tail fiber protein [Promethearchaeota archaeon]|nr:MAG: tail fiber protein [Candidatus Lokiarchaeota archaeon]